MVDQNEHRWRRRGPYDSRWYGEPAERGGKGKSECADKALAKALKAARKNAALTQAELAEKLGVGRSRVAQWESAARGVPHNLIDKIKETLPDAIEWRVRHHWWSNANARLVVEDD